MDTALKLLIKYPTRQRPDAFRHTLGLYYAKLSGQHSYEFLVSADNDDPTMNNHEMRAFLESRPNLLFYFGDSKNKVQAINADMAGKQFDILLLASDDMRPVEEGYDQVIVSEMLRHFPNLDGVIHFNDGRVGRRLNTLVVMGMPYYERFGYIYHPDYTSLWCDNEFGAVSESLGKTVYVDKVIIKHDWDEFGDALRQSCEKPYREDGRIFATRKAAGFPQRSVLPLAPVPVAAPPKPKLATVREMLRPIKVKQPIRIRHGKLR